MGAHLVASLMVHLGNIPHSLATILFLLPDDVVAELGNRPPHDLLLVSRQFILLARRHGCSDFEACSVGRRIGHH